MCADQALASWGDLKPLRSKMSQKTKTQPKPSSTGRTKAPDTHSTVVDAASQGRSSSLDRKLAVNQRSIGKSTSSYRSSVQPPDPKKRDTAKPRGSSLTRHGSRSVQVDKGTVPTVAVPASSKNTSTSLQKPKKLPNTSLPLEGTAKKHSEKKDNQESKKGTSAVSHITSSKRSSIDASKKVVADVYQKEPKGKKHQNKGVSAVDQKKLREQGENKSQDPKEEKLHTSTATIQKRAPGDLSRRSEPEPVSQMPQEGQNAKVDHETKGGMKGGSDTDHRSSLSKPELGNLAFLASSRMRTPSDADESYNYDDDFEDYESDFEKDDGDDDVYKDASGISNGTSSSSIEVSESEKDPSSPQDIAEVLQNRPKDLSHWTSEPAFEVPKEPVKMPSSFSAHNFFNFASAKKKEENKKMLTKAQQRARDILEMVSMDETTFQVFDMPPASYDTFITAFGQANTKQMLSQTDSADDEECQTEFISTFEKWTQHPAHDYSGVGGGTTEVTTSEIQLGKTTAGLIDFLQNASMLMLRVMDDELTSSSDKQLEQQQETAKFSKGFLRLCPLPFLQGCPVSAMHFSGVNANCIITAHHLTNELGEFLTNLKDFPGKGILCIWNLSSPTEPKELLVSHTLPTCCEWSPFDVTTVVSGSVDGSLELWDLRDNFSLSRKFVTNQGEFDKREYKLKFLAYSTASIIKGNTHYCPIVAIRNLTPSNMPVGVSSRRHHRTKGHENSFDILSLDEEGMLILWAVVEAASKWEGSQQDLGLAPMAKLKLLKTATVRVQDSLPSVELGAFDGLRTYSFDLSPSHPGQVFVTTDLGLVFHCNLYGCKASPRLYRSRNDATIVEAKCIAFSPHQASFFLLGTRDGTLRLHSTKSELPVREWTNPGELEIKLVRWSPSNPAAFFSLDASGRIFCWNLTRNGQAPVLTLDTITPRVSMMDITRPTTAALSDIHVAWAMEDGMLQVHFIEETFVKDEGDYKLAKECLENL